MIDLADLSDDDLPAQVLAEWRERAGGDAPANLGAARRAHVQRKMIRCGRRGCHCRTGARHGPYWYAYWQENGRQRTRYVGVTLARLPDIVDDVTATTRPTDPSVSVPLPRRP
jgi:hypothetical protein